MVKSTAAEALDPLLRFSPGTGLMIPHQSGWLRRFFIAAALSASAVLLAGQCTQQQVTGPYTLSPSPALPTIRVRTLIITITRGKVITTYTITGLPGEKNQPLVQIKENGQPLTYDPSENPLGLYYQTDAADFIQGLINECNSIGAQFAPISHPRLQADSISSATAVFGQTANVYISADFNNDGVPDNATAGNGSVQITLYNQRSGALTPKNIAIGGSTSTGIVTADFNGDGNADLAVTVFNASGNGSVVVLLGNGDGTFKAPGNNTVGMQPLSLAAVDLNGDGKRTWLSLIRTRMAMPEPSTCCLEMVMEPSPRPRSTTPERFRRGSSLWI